MSASEKDTCLGMEFLISILEQRRDEHEADLKQAASDLVDAIRPMERAECMKSLAKSLAARDAMNEAIAQAQNLYCFYVDGQWRLS